MLIAVNQDDLIDINPRPSKYSFKHLTTPTQKQVHFDLEFLHKLFYK